MAVKKKTRLDPLNVAYGVGAAVVIIGAMFKFLNFPFANEMLFVGNVVPLQDQHGNPFQGRIVAVGDSDVTVDLNHPFAGKTLYFSGELLEVREAHEVEIEHGHVHEHGDHSHH